MNRPYMCVTLPGGREREIWRGGEMEGERERWRDGGRKRGGVGVGEGGSGRG